MNDEFSRFHPLVNIVFYICVLGITMFQMQIGLIIISFIVALIYYIFLKKEWNLKFFCGVIVVFLTSAVINPLFSHRGSTLLFYLFTGNPVTLESIVYGFATAGIICAMIMWFGSFNIIITTDKIEPIPIIDITIVFTQITSYPAYSYPSITYFFRNPKGKTTSYHRITRTYPVVLLFICT